MEIRKLAIVAALAFSAAAQAATVYTDDFNADLQGLNSVPTGWSVTGTGTVDIIGTGFFDEIPGNGNYIDLDGSNGVAGLLSRSVSVGAGTYSATFSLGGNNRDGTTDPVAVTFGSTTIYMVPPSSGFTTYTLWTTLSSAGSLVLSFQDGRDGNVGALLDNVTVSSVPEPTSLSLLLAGVAALGFAARRRRSA